MTGDPPLKRTRYNAENSLEAIYMKDILLPILTVLYLGLVWAGHMKNYDCYLDTQSVYVFDNTNQYKDWKQVVKLYDEDRFVESATQNFHWDPQEDACVGGRGISRITDKNLMYQFETGWQYAFGHSFK